MMVAALAAQRHGNPTPKRASENLSPHGRWSAVATFGCSWLGSVSESLQACSPIKRGVANALQQMVTDQLFKNTTKVADAEGAFVLTLCF